LHQAYAGQGRIVEALAELEEVLAFDSISGSANRGAPLALDSLRDSANGAPADLLDDAIELIARLKRQQAHERRTLAA
jgi:hypothetical protein